MASNYGLLGPPGWASEGASGPLGQPHPDYFTALLWKQLVGTTVVPSAAAGAGLGAWDSHVWCGAKGGSPVLTFASLSPSPVSLQLPAGAAPTPRTEYVLTSVADGFAPNPVGPNGFPPSLQADAVFLNGAPLATNADGTLPAVPLPGRAVPAGGSAIVVPPWSYGFIVLDGAALSVC